MSLPQSPPTTSGIVVISGSNSFSRATSDFPVIQNLFLTSAGTRDQITLFNSFVLDLDLDLEVISTDVTTSGIVILNYALDIGIPFIVPVVIDERIFPFSPVSGVRLFPETVISGVRIFPVLPQFATLTPGD